MADMNFGVHILPDSDDSYDLGRNNKEWSHIYAKTVMIDGVQAATQTDVNNLKPSVNNNTIIFSENTQSVTYGAEFVISTNNSSSSDLTGSIQSDSLQNGKIIYYMLKYATPNNSNISLTLAYPSGSNSESIPVYKVGTNRLNSSLPANCIITLIYYSNAFYLVATPGITV